MAPRTEPWGTPHTMEQVMRRKIRLPRVVAGLTGRIETIVVLIPPPDRKSLVDAEEYHDRPYRRPPIGSKEQAEPNLLRRLQEECPSRRSAQRSPLSGKLRFTDWNLRRSPFEIRWARSWRATSLSSSFERTDRLDIGRKDRTSDESRSTFSRRGEMYTVLITAGTHLFAGAQSIQYNTTQLY